ncbi:ATP-dependent DNA helicase [Elysia marginata]|uniref:ATP-dependent DNA helicase n=1 Tax=Elysia marginata TaxID=1093978 RepID=A0AAV4K086_9GAST|nr:ATP-dependent DNA helicase [Elysia marginata]
MPIWPSTLVIFTKSSVGSYANEGVRADVINKHAPIVNRKIVIRPNKPWYTDDIREAKKIQRSAEKKWRKTHLEVHRQAFVNARKNTNKLITAAKQIYTKNKISDSKSNPKELFRIVNGLIKHSKPGADLPQSNDNRELATKFADHFDNKIEHIRKELDNTNVSSVNNSSETCETSLRRTTEDEVKNNYQVYAQ